MSDFQKKFSNIASFYKNRGIREESEKFSETISEIRAEKHS